MGARDVGAEPGAVAGEVSSLLTELDVATEANILTVAAYFHLAFERIHPFADGNGRVGRELMNYLLIAHGHPPVIVFDEDKLAYYGALEAFDAEGDIEPMKAFLQVEAIKSWR